MPIARLRNEMKLLIDHKSERPMDIRAGEAWPEVLSHFNHIRGQLLTLRREVSEYEAMLGSTAISELNKLPAPTHAEEGNAGEEGSIAELPDDEAIKNETTSEKDAVETVAN